MNQAIRDAHTIIILYSVHTPHANWQKLEIDASLGRKWHSQAVGPNKGGNLGVIQSQYNAIINNSPVYQRTIEEICAAILPKQPASSIVSRAFGPSQNNPFRRIRAEYFEDEPALLARFFAAPDALKMGTLEDKTDLLGHTIQSVTGTYARSTPEALEDAVNRLTEPRGAVIQFKRKAS